MAVASAGHLSTRVQNDIGNVRLAISWAAAAAGTFGASVVGAGASAHGPSAAFLPPIVARGRAAGRRGPLAVVAASAGSSPIGARNADLAGAGSFTTTCGLLVVAAGAATAAAAARRHPPRNGSWRRRPVQVAAARDDTIDIGISADGGFGSMYDIPIEGLPEDQKRQVPRIIMEGDKEVNVSGYERRPGGQSQGSDPDSMYFWKMSKDKRTIDVVFPIEDFIRKDDIIFRLGELPKDPARGPSLELGYRKRNDAGRMKEHLVVNGTILNAINRSDCMWVIEEIADVRCCVLTITRPSMMRMRHDTVLKRSVEEERIEPQTWDALLFEERFKPDVTDKVYFDISLAGEPAGRMEFGLFGGVVPKTVKNFVGLVTGEYEDDDGNMQKSAHCLKNTTADTIMDNHLLGMGNPGLDIVTLEFTHEEFKEYYTFFEDFKIAPRKIGKVEKFWTPRWGADLGRPYDEEGNQFKEGGPVDGHSEEQLQIILEVMKEIIDRGEGGKINFFRPEFAKGCDVTGGTFPAEAFRVSHQKRGILSMDRDEDKNLQGSNFFITFKEFPQMDKRWVVFGEVLQGHELLNRIEDEFEGRPEEVLIADCGVLPVTA